jgi:hypothetical protein
MKRTQKPALNYASNEAFRVMQGFCRKALSGFQKEPMRKMCNHIHRIHLTFIESIKNKIYLSTLTEVKQEVPSFLHFLQDNLRLITLTGASDTTNNGFIPHILLQL